MPDEHGVLSTQLWGINVIVGLCFWNLSEGTFLPLRIFNSTMPCSFSRDYFYEQEQSKILKQGMNRAKRENETLLFNKKFIKYPRLTFQVLKPMRARVNFNGKKNWQKNYWTLSNLAKCHALTFARRKENIKPSPVGPWLTCHHTNK